MLAELVRLPHTKETINTIIDFIGDDQAIFKEFMDYFLGEDWRITQKCSWVLGKIGEKKPHLIKPYHKRLVSKLKSTDKGAFKRNIVRLYQYADIPEEVEGELYSQCLNFILNHSEAIAIRAFSMGVCEQVATKYTELVPELISAVEATVPNVSAGLKNRAMHTLRRLNKLILTP